MTPRQFFVGLALMVVFAIGFQAGESVKEYEDENAVMDALGTEGRVSVVDAAWQAERIIRVCRAELVERGDMQ